MSEFKNMTEEKNKLKNTKIPWHQSFKWWHLLILSIVSFIIYHYSQGILFGWIFYIGIVFTVITFIKNRKK